MCVMFLLDRRFREWGRRGGGHDPLRAARVAELVATHQGRRRNGWGAAPLFDAPARRGQHSRRGGLRSLNALAGEPGAVSRAQAERVFAWLTRVGSGHPASAKGNSVPQTGPWTGDPVWLADVLRAEGVRLVEYPGWRDRGHGDFQDIRGVMVHHTGSDHASAASIAIGRPDLPGPLSQLHIARDGTVTVVAVGVAWHAGVGMYPWLPTNMGNWHMIGVECANSGTSPTAPHRTNWPDAQYDALVR